MVESHWSAYVCSVTQKRELYDSAALLSGYEAHRRSHRALGERTFPMTEAKLSILYHWIEARRCAQSAGAESVVSR